MGWASISIYTSTTYSCTRIERISKVHSSIFSVRARHVTLVLQSNVSHPDSGMLTFSYSSNTIVTGYRDLIGSLLSAPKMTGITRYILHYGKVRSCCRLYNVKCFGKFSGRGSPLHDKNNVPILYFKRRESQGEWAVVRVAPTTVLMVLVVVLFTTFM